MYFHSSMKEKKKKRKMCTQCLNDDELNAQKKFKKVSELGFTVQN